jgi:hypothetical protein
LITKIQTPNLGSKVKWSEDLAADNFDPFFIEDLAKDNLGNVKLLNTQIDLSVTGGTRSNFSASKKHSKKSTKTRQKTFSPIVS